MEFDVQTADRQNRGILLFTFAETESPLCTHSKRPHHQRRREGRARVVATGTEEASRISP
jgi:hypothetical protein